MSNNLSIELDRRDFGRLAVGGLIAAARRLLRRLDRDSPPDKVWGKLGAGNGQFSKPRAIAIDANDQLYIVDMTARIQVFDADGKFIRAWQTPEHANGRPTGLTISTRRQPARGRHALLPHPHLHAAGRIARRTRRSAARWVKARASSVS